jgi:hypothetical protein
MSLLDEAKAASAEFDKKAAEIKKQEIEREIAYADRQLISKIKEGQQFEYFVNNSRDDELSPPKFKATGEIEMLRILEDHFKKEGFTTNVFERITHWGENLTVLSVNLPGKAQRWTPQDQLPSDFRKPGVDII